MSKKNRVLFIGPYRDISSDGDISRNYLSSIESKTKNKVSSIPIYLYAKDRISNSVTFSSENYTTETSYDTIVQHLPIEHIQYFKNYNYSIAFPIVNNISNLGIDNNFEVLKLFDKVLVTGKHIKKALEEKNIANIEIYNPNSYLTINKDVIFNIHNFSDAKKFYFIGDIDDDIEIIKQLIISFNIATLNNSHSVLVFFLTHDGKSDISNLQKLIDDLKINLGLKYSYTNKEVFIIKPFNTEEILAIHNSCDVFLSLNTHNHRIMDEVYAKSCNNKIISIDNYFDIEIPYYDRNHGYNFEYKKPTISTNKLIQIIKNEI